MIVSVYIYVKLKIIRKNVVGMHKMRYILPGRRTRLKGF